MNKASTTKILEVLAGVWLGGRKVLPKKSPRWCAEWGRLQKTEPMGSGSPWAEVKGAAAGQLVKRLWGVWARLSAVERAARGRLS